MAENACITSHNAIQRVRGLYHDPMDTEPATTHTPLAVTAVSADLAAPCAHATAAEYETHGTLLSLVAAPTYRFRKYTPVELAQLRSLLPAPNVYVSNAQGRVIEAQYNTWAASAGLPIRTWNSLCQALMYVAGVGRCVTLKLVRPGAGNTIILCTRHLLPRVRSALR